jgi:hypothetical protein
VAIRMCGITISGIASSLPITGISTSPIGIIVYLTLTRRGSRR